MQHKLNGQNKTWFNNTIFLSVSSITRIMFSRFEKWVSHFLSLIGTFTIFVKFTMQKCLPVVPWATQRVPLLVQDLLTLVGHLIFSGSGCTVFSFLCSVLLSCLSFLRLSSFVMALSVSFWFMSFEYSLRILHFSDCCYINFYVW